MQCRDAREVLCRLCDRLSSEDTSITEKYRVLFYLKGCKDPEALTAMAQGLSDPSALFRHEVAYCLGQTCSPKAIKLLAKTLSDRREHAMVRHEAGEGLGAIGTAECIDHLREHQADGCLEVAQTCQLALQRIAFYESAEGSQYRDESKYSSVDPAPAYPASAPFDTLRETLVGDSLPIFDRYRALFALRNMGGSEAIRALAASFESNSALLKHEVAYVLGQMQDTEGIATLRRVLLDPEEHAMVRHEAAEALGSIGDAGCVELLKQCSEDPDAIVADSCVVALDMLEYELSGELQYVRTE